MADVGFSLFPIGAGGASAAATSGFVPVGGGGGVLRGTEAGPGVVDALGNLTVATGFSGVSFWDLDSGSFFIVIAPDTGCCGGGTGGPGGPCAACC